jgi:uncharacterized protein
LAGRTVILKLLPLSTNELLSKYNFTDTDELLFSGFYPGIYSEKQNPTIAYRSYFETYIERDLRQMLEVKNLRLFQKFIRLCAGRTGQLFNASNLANETGVSTPTIQHWLSILEASFIVFMLEPFYANISKRLIKSPKLYFTDPGFACYLLGIENPSQLSKFPLRGQLFENMVVLELLKYKYNKGLDANLFFYRDNHQNEIDAMMKVNQQFNIFEIKSSETFHSDFLKGLNYFKANFPDLTKKSYLIYSGEQKLISEENHSIINFKDIYGVFSSL